MGFVERLRFSPGNLGAQLRDAGWRRVLVDLGSGCFRKLQFSSGVSQLATQVDNLGVVIEGVVGDLLHRGFEGLAGTETGFRGGDVAGLAGIV